ncbi:MAG: prkC 30, partial [Gemmataceae bacterium]|nr:prkC 30 [Gemmataceae bacterium]
DARRSANDNADTARNAAADEAEAKRAAERDRDAARRAERAGKGELLQAIISEAKAGRFSRRVGQRFDTLDAIRKAVVLARELGQPETTFDQLRNLAVAALALPDMKPDAAWIGQPTDVDKHWDWPVPDPDFRRVAVKHQTGAVSVRRVGTGPRDCGEVFRLPGLNSEVTLLWSPDGRHLAVHHWHARYRRLLAWRIENDTPAVALDVPAGCVGFVFTPDGRQLVAVDDGAAFGTGGVGARVYDLGTGKPARTVRLPVGAGQAVAHHPHRPVLAVGLPGRIAIVDLTTGEETGSLPSPSYASLVWHPHGELLCVVLTQHIDIWDVARGRRNWRLEHSGEGLYASFSRGGDLLVTGGWAGRVRVWSPHTGRELIAATGWGLGCGPNERLSLRLPPTAADPTGPLAVVETAREYRTLPVGAGQTAIMRLTVCSLHPAGRLLAVATRQGVGLLDTITGEERAFLRCASCRTVVFEPDGSLLVTDTDGVVRWPVAPDPDSPTRLRIGPPGMVPVGPAGETVARSADGATLAVSDLESGAAVWERDRPHDARRLRHSDCRHVAVSPDGTLVATGSWSGRGIKVWETATGRQVRDLLPETGGTIPGFSPDGRWLVNVNSDQRWRVADWAEGPKAPAGTSGSFFSPDGRLVASNGNGFVVLADAATGRELVRLEDPYQDRLKPLLFSPDGALLIGASDESVCVRVWDLRRIRTGLVDLGLDWGGPAYPPGPPADPGTRPLQVNVIDDDPSGRTERAMERQRERAVTAVWLNPFDPEARLALADQLLYASRTREAVAQLTGAVAFRPEQLGGYAMRARARYALGDWSGCVTDADAVRARRPDDQQLLGYRSQALIRLHRYADALPDLTALIRLDPTDAVGFLDRGDAYHSLGKPNEAAADWTRAGALVGPQSDPQLIKRAASRLITCPPPNRDTKRGLELAELANEKRPDTAGYLSTLGLAQYRAGLIADAVRSSERSRVVASGVIDADNLFVLAMCHARRGDPAQARGCYHLAIRGGRTAIPRPADGQQRVLRREAEDVLIAAGVAVDPAPPPREK